MLCYEKGKGFEAPDLVAFEIARLERLLTDLEALQAGTGPTPEILAEAPILDRYHVGLRGAHCLFGESSGHPTLPGIGRQIVTSDLQVHAPTAGWARTLSRWYRLGRPAMPEPGGSE